MKQNVFISFHCMTYLFHLYKNGTGFRIRRKVGKSTKPLFISLSLTNIEFSESVYIINNKKNGMSIPS